MMKQFSKMRVRTQLILNFLVICILILGLGIYGQFAGNNNEREIANLYKNATGPMSNIASII